MHTGCPKKSMVDKTSNMHSLYFELRFVSFFFFLLRSRHPQVVPPLPFGGGGVTWGKINVWRKSRGKEAEGGIALVI